MCTIRSTRACLDRYLCLITDSCLFCLIIADRLKCRKLCLIEVVNLRIESTPDFLLPLGILLFLLDFIYFFRTGTYQFFYHALGIHTGYETCHSHCHIKYLLIRVSPPRIRSAAVRRTHPKSLTSFVMGSPLSSLINQKTCHLPCLCKHIQCLLRRNLTDYFIGITVCNRN